MASVYGRFALSALPAIGPGAEVEADAAALEVANRILHERVSELEARNEALETFAHAVAHDLKGTTGKLVGYAGFMRSAHADLTADETEKCLTGIHSSALQLSDIIDELLLLAGLRQEKVEIAALNMADIVDRALSRLTDRIDSCVAEVILPERWPSAVGYGPWVEEVWVNYIDNALKYGGRPLHVELGAERVDGVSRFWVRDNGRGLAPEEQSRLFSPFTRIDQAHTKGHGLGLTIVRHIVERLGGRVDVESPGVPGQGSVFSFTLAAERRSHVGIEASK